MYLGCYKQNRKELDQNMMACCVGISYLMRVCMHLAEMILGVQVDLAVQDYLGDHHNLFQGALGGLEVHE